MGPEVREGRGRGGLGGGDRLEQRGRVEKVFGAKNWNFLNLKFPEKICDEMFDFLRCGGIRTRDFGQFNTLTTSIHASAPDQAIFTALEYKLVYTNTQSFRQIL